MGGSKQSSPEQVNPVQTTQQTFAAKEQYDPKSQDLAFSLLNSPTSGLGATSKLYQDVFNQLNPQYAGANQAVYNNLLSSLQSPNYITPEQQAAQDAIRARSQNELQRGLNTQANLGGNLYGGNNFNQIGQQLQQLQQGFSANDIALNNQNHQQSVSNLLALLGLTPQPGIQATQFESAAPSGNNVYQGQVNQNMAAYQAQAQQDANRAALLSSLFTGLGTAAGGYFGGPAGAAAGGKAGSSIVQR